MSTKLITADELARDLGMTVDQLHRLRRRRRWPYVQITRLDIRFTPGQVEEIVEMHSVTPAKDPTPEQTSGLPGQTERSKQRSA